MTWAPDYDVPENVSPFKPLPLLDRCAECRKPITSLESFAVVHEGVLRKGLCEPCAGRAASSLPSETPTP